MKIAEMLAEKTVLLLFKEIDAVEANVAVLRKGIRNTQRDLEGLDAAMVLAGRSAKSGGVQGVATGY